MEVAPKLTPKRLAFLKELVPALTRVAILWQPGALHDETFGQILSSLNVIALSGEPHPRRRHRFVGRSYAPGAGPIRLLRCSGMTTKPSRDSQQPHTSALFQVFDPRWQTRELVPAEIELLEPGERWEVRAAGWRANPSAWGSPSGRALPVVIPAPCS
jgi:hypothetical protein